MATELVGEVEKITFTNEQNAFSIAKLKVDDSGESVTIVGTFIPPTPGERIKVTGEWTTHPTYGRQLSIHDYEVLFPTTVSGIKNYLSSGMLKGIGPVMAERIVKRFGTDTLDVIQNNPERLGEIEGIGPSRIASIKEAWSAQKEIREVMLFLQSHGVSTGHATRIFKQYGQHAVSLIRKNPYRLATDIAGFGFITADRIAEKLNIAKDSPVRAESGILYMLNSLSNEGHTLYPYQSLLAKCEQVLQSPRAVLESALKTLAAEKQIVLETIDSLMPQEDDRAVFLARYHYCEDAVAKQIGRLIAAHTSLPPLNPSKATAWAQKQLAITLAEAQITAVEWAVREKMMIITGGPGTGKTTIINAVIKIFARNKAGILLAAPTGRAAKRMAEATGCEAKTIHRLLEYSVKEGGFLKNRHDPLNCDVLIIDETSMIDTMLMYYLITAVPAKATVILVGDRYQLPSIGGGNILKDCIESERIPVVELNEIFRQAKESRIVVNAHRIKEGLFPDCDSGTDELVDFYFIEKDNPADVLNLIVELVKERIPRRFGFDPLTEIQVITPMNRGILGVENMNTVLQEVLNPHGEQFRRGERTFRLNDKVMQTRNNYTKEIFNGDIGKIVAIDRNHGEISVRYDGRDLVYDQQDLEELVPAYAVTVHKSQGSEYPAVVFPLSTQHFMLLQRNLIYTAITRGKRLVVLIGSKRALHMGIQNTKTMKRYTSLAYRLRSSIARNAPHQP